MPHPRAKRHELTAAQGLRCILNPDDSDVLRHPWSQQELPGAPALLWIDDGAPDALLELHIRFAKRAIAAYSGRNRNVFLLSERLVVKLPRGLDGFADNDWEGSVSNTPESRDDQEHVQYPKTRLAYVDDVPVVFMERITPLTGLGIKERFGHEPDWVCSVDGGQVGVNRHGRLVAYDYGLT